MKKVKNIKPTSFIPVEKRFQLMENYTRSLATYNNDSTNILVIFGVGGAGKTYTVTKVLKELGMNRILPDGKMSIYDWSQAINNYKQAVAPPVDSEHSFLFGIILNTIMSTILFLIPYILATIMAWILVFLDFIGILGCVDNARELKIKKNDINTDDIELIKWNNYYMVSGKETPKAIFETFELFPNNLIIFDDCDSILEHSESVEILKGVGDLKDERVVQWGNSGNKRTINFNGKIIIITNKSGAWLDKNCQAIMSGAKQINASMNKEELIERMEQIGLSKTFLDENKFDIDTVKTALDYTIIRKDYLSELSLRTLYKIASNIREFGYDEEALDYNFCKRPS